MIGSAAVLAAVYALSGSIGYGIASGFLASLPLLAGLGTRLLLHFKLKNTGPRETRSIEGSDVTVRLEARVPAGFQLRVVDEGACSRVSVSGPIVECVLKGLRIGLRRLRLPLLAVYDPFLLSYNIVDLGYVVVRVAPKPYSAALVAEYLSRRGYIESGLAESRRGDEILYTREAEPHEPLTLVDWKAYARLRRRVVKVFASSGLRRLSMAVVATPASLKGWPSPFERAARLTLGLVEALCRLGVRVRVALIYAGKIVEAQPCLPESVAEVFASYPWGETASPQDTSLVARLEPPRIVFTGGEKAYAVELEDTLTMVLSEKAEEGIAATEAEVVKLIAGLLGERV